jgi:hypothetical protein
MERIDRDIAQLAVFKTSSAGGKDDLGMDEGDYGDENADTHKFSAKGGPLSPKSAALKKGQPPPQKFKGISSVSQLKHLLRNYDALV